MSTTAAPVHPVEILSRAEFGRRARELLGGRTGLGWELAQGSATVGAALARYLLLCLAVGPDWSGDPRDLSAIDSLDDAYNLHARQASTRPFDTLSRSVEGLHADGGRQHLVGRIVTLRPFTEGDVPWAVAVLTHPALLQGPPLRGVPPQPGQLASILTAGVYCQFVVSAADGTPVALVRTTHADLHNRHAHLELIYPPDALLSAWSAEGMALFVDYCFEALGLRKLYLELTVDSYDRLPNAARELVECEGTLRNHRLVLGRWVDVAACCIWRDCWAERRSVWLPATPPLSQRSR